MICADQGGGLQVYDVQELKNGNTQPSFQIGTNKADVTALVPNPSPENGYVVAVVLGTGELLLANLRDRQLVNGKNGMVLKSAVSCVSWSTKGKQLVVGLRDGSAVQMDPEGVIKAVIPRPPSLDGVQHGETLSAIRSDRVTNGFHSLRCFLGR